jgi:hypothetical protein
MADHRSWEGPKLYDTFRPSLLKADATTDTFDAIPTLKVIKELSEVAIKELEEQSVIDQPS